LKEDNNGKILRNKYVTADNLDIVIRNQRIESTESFTYLGCLREKDKWREIINIQVKTIPPQTKLKDIVHKYKERAENRRLEETTGIKQRKVTEMLVKKRYILIDFLVLRPHNKMSDSYLWSHFDVLKWLKSFIKNETVIESFQDQLDDEIFHFQNNNNDDNDDTSQNQPSTASAVFTAFIDNDNDDILYDDNQKSDEVVSPKQRETTTIESVQKHHQPQQAKKGRYKQALSTDESDDGLNENNIEQQTTTASLAQRTNTKETNRGGSCAWRWKKIDGRTERR
ncbi:unnamed protein product, partial [Didymodactylos carnosus]